jgi:hypothetical protein
MRRGIDLARALGVQVEFRLLHEKDWRPS